VKIVWAALALRDVEAIGDFIATDNSQATAARLMEDIFKSVDKLADFPHLGRAGRIPSTRELVVANTPFIVPYRVQDGKVEILAVFHGARRWPQKFD
jgi:toxin ParE1/3/4